LIGYYLKLASKTQPLFVYTIYLKKNYLALSLILTSILLFSSTFAQNYLSNLHATKDSPLFTTYAAAMERSEFILDEGYHFLFYDSSCGIDFTTDTGGDLCLAFKKGDDYIYESKDFYRQVVINTSYPDMVKYYYTPFENLQVGATFFVYNSHVAIHDIVLKNIGKQKLDFKVIPFIRNNCRTFNDVQFHNKYNAITFDHEEIPDSWTINHKVPCVALVQDVLLLSRKPESMSSYYSYGGSGVEIPLEVDVEKKPIYVVWGRMSHKEMGACHHRNPKPKIKVMLNNDPTKILTESAPRWGNTEENIGNGYYSIELGNFDEIKNGDTYAISLLCCETGDYATIIDTIRYLSDEQIVQKDIVFRKNSILTEPTNIDIDILDGGREVRLFWKNDESVTFYIYRRNYGKNGYYELIGETTNNYFFDRNIQDDKIYGYILVAADQNGKMSVHSEEVNNLIRSDFLTDIHFPDQSKNNVKNFARVIAMPINVELKPNKDEHFRIIRAVARPCVSQQDLINRAKDVISKDLNKYLKANEKLFKNIPKLSSSNQDLEMLYWSAFNLMRQVMLPPEGKCSYNYYVFSREPTWGWGHGGQVFHESLTMLSYSYMDPVSAMNSQRVYSERQYESGYINYRTGPYLDEVIEYNDQLTSSAPWYAYQNWEIYKITRDKKFLEEIYESSKRFYNYYVTNRDSDNDGLCEWGAHAVLESVRDGLVAVWDEVGWPSNFEALDLNCMLVKEEKSLAAMAQELDKLEEAKMWEEKAEVRSVMINETMWDEETGFYYHVDKRDNDFSFRKKNDLKREEIIGFLPLWAGIADENRANRLISKLTDETKFWRKYGIPTLAADDPYFDPKGYWNGPIWVQWNFLIVDGLLQYGYINEAKELVMRVSENMIAQLKRDHQFWEFYSPDYQWAGYHRQYIWAGIINRMLMEMQGIEKQFK
jgi:hypothetical protein